MWTHVSFCIDWPARGCIRVVGGVCFFFFQAEGGIRDLVRARGVGDVYKGPGFWLFFFFDLHLGPAVAVSFTHLTLPTKREV